MYFIELDNQEIAAVSGGFCRRYFDCIINFIVIVELISVFVLVAYYVVKDVYFV